MFNYCKKPSHQLAANYSLKRKMRAITQIVVDRKSALSSLFMHQRVRFNQSFGQFKCIAVQSLVSNLVNQFILLNEKFPPQMSPCRVFVLEIEHFLNSPLYMHEVNFLLSETQSPSTLHVCTYCEVYRSVGRRFQFNYIHVLCITICAHKMALHVFNIVKFSSRFESSSLW